MVNKASSKVAASYDADRNCADLDLGKAFEYMLCLQQCEMYAVWSRYWDTICSPVLISVNTCESQGMFAPI